jgi:hypothetical protein
MQAKLTHTCLGLMAASSFVARRSMDAEDRTS